jgi:uncharacterized membrane protein YfcA
MEEVSWVVVVPLLLAGLVGAGVGNRAAGMVTPATLAARFSGFILLLAAYTAATSVAGLM